MNKIHSTRVAPNFVNNKPLQEGYNTKQYKTVIATTDSVD